MYPHVSYNRLYLGCDDIYLNYSAYKSRVFHLTSSRYVYVFAVLIKFDYIIDLLNFVKTIFAENCLKCAELIKTFIW